MDTGTGRAIRVGRIGQTALAVHPVWLAGVPCLTAVFATLPAQTAAERLLVALQPLLWASCVLLHEAGHALAARRFGVGVRSVALMPLGGVTAFDTELRSGREEFSVSAAGPAASLALALLGAAGAAGTDGPLAGTLRALALFNAAVFAVNALPALPLDGGRVARAAFSLLGRDRERATIIVDRIGMVSGYALGGLAGAFITLIPQAPGFAVATAGVLVWTGLLLVRMTFHGRRRL
jgi:Zn-dependent protease